MSPTPLEEELKAIRTTKEYYQKKIKQLNEEEKKILKQLKGRYL